MGKRGPKPTPTVVLKTRDSWRADARAGEPQPRRGLPVRPLFLEGDDLACAEWDRVCDELDQMKLLCTADAATIGAYCEAVAEFQRLAQQVREEGHTTVTDKGNVIQHPLVGAKNKARADLLRYAAHFGLSPSSRVGLEVGGGASDGDEDEANFAA